MTTVEQGPPPILPSWLKSGAELKDNTTKLVKRTAHRSGYHGVRSPLYLFKLAMWSPRGAWRTFYAAWKVIFDHESKDLRLHHVSKLESKEYLALRKTRDERVKNRSKIAGVLALPVVISMAVGWFLLPLWAFQAAGILVVLTLGVIGKPLNAPAIKPATLTPGAPGPLRAPHVTKALCSLGIGAMRDPEQIGLLMDVARIRGGYQIDMELPQGVAANAVVEKRMQLSAALRRELGCVWPATGSRHEGHLKLVVRDEPMSKGKQPPWPLMKAGTVDVFKPAPLATDQQDNWVPITLAYTSGAIGAVPRVGKTYYLREIGLIGALDPRCRLYTIDLKGTGDLSPLALVSHFYSVGDEPEAMEEQLVALRNLRHEMRRRAKVIRELPRTECPENKTTSTLADRKDLGLEPVLVLIDECQAAFENEDPKVAKEYVAIVTDLVKRGPAMGIMTYVATQRPDAKSIPTAIADNLIVRIALKMSGQVANDQILGTSSYQAGQRATLFSFDEKGLALLKADGSECQVVRSVAGLNAPTAEKIATRARQVRQAAGRLTGQSAGDEMEAEATQVEFLDYLDKVFANAGQPTAMHLDQMVASLTSLAGAYASLSNSSLAGLLRGAGVRVEPVYATRTDDSNTTQRGTKWEWVESVSATSAIGAEAEEQQARNLTVVR